MFSSDEHLGPVPASRAKSCTDVYADAGNIGASTFDLAGVQPRYSWAALRRAKKMATTKRIPGRCRE